MAECKNCDGEGRIDASDPSRGAIKMEKCDDCGGTGVEPAPRCTICGGDEPATMRGYVILGRDDPRKTARLEDMCPECLGAVTDAGDLLSSVTLVPIS